jgi:hypothetical protein
MFRYASVLVARGFVDWRVAEFWTSVAPIANMLRQSKLLSRTLRTGSRAVVARAVAANFTTGAAGFRSAAPIHSGPAQFGSRLGSVRNASTFKAEYDDVVADRAKVGIPPKPLDAEQTGKVVEILKNPPKGQEEFYLNLLVNRINPGVDEAAYVKAAFLTAIAKGEAKSPLVTPERATELLATMQGGYNIATLVDLLDHPKLANKAADGLCQTILMFEAFHDVEQKAKAGNKAATRVMKSWAEAEWFLKKKEVAEKITVTVFKVSCRFYSCI